jgi:hypothetical protein
VPNGCQAHGLHIAIQRQHLKNVLSGQLFVRFGNAARRVFNLTL